MPRGIYKRRKPQTRDSLIRSSLRTARRDCTLASRAYLRALRQLHPAEPLASATAITTELQSVLKTIIGAQYRLTTASAAIVDLLRGA